MNRKLKALLGWIVVLTLVLVLLRVSGTGRRDVAQENFSTFLRDVQDDRIAGVTIRENDLTVELNDSHAVYTTVGHADEDLVKELSERGAYVLYEEESKSFLRSWGIILIPLFLVLVLFFYIARQAKSSGGIMSLGKSRARRIEENDVTFAQVGGLAEAKERFGAIIDFLKAPKRWVKAGVRLPRGVLLVGPPGCGKTLLARAVAGEAGVPFFSVSASEFVEVFVGVGAARIRDMFDQARREAPSLIFIDELDAIGRRRGSGIGSSHDEREHTLNQLLAALDGFEKNQHVVVIAATNRPDVLDSALLRPGRFDQRIAVDVPDRDGRLEMLALHTSAKPLADGVSLEELANRTSQFTGAELESLANEAALLAVRAAGGSDSPAVSMEHFERALARTESGARVFDRLDAILIESASQVAQPTGEVGVRVTLVDGTVCVGRIVWADGHFVKLSATDDGADRGEEIVVTKARIRQVEALAGAEPLPAGEVIGDRWAQRVVDTM